MRIYHDDQSGLEDNGNPEQVQPSSWNQDHVVELEAALALLAQLTPGPDKLPYFADGNTANTTALTPFARVLLALTNAASVLAAIGGVPLAGGTMTGPLILSGDPSQSLHAATRRYVDNVKAGFKPKDSVIAASTANVSIASAPATIDGVTLAEGNRVLLKNQTTAANNGVYVFVAEGEALTRAPDFDLWSKMPGAMMIVEQGTVNADSGWVSTADEGGTLGTTAITFSQFFGTGLFQPSSTNLSTVAALASVANLSTLANLASIANLSALAGLTGASGKVPSFTGAGAMALLSIGGAANNLVQLDGSGKIPAIDGSQLTNIQNPGGRYSKNRKINGGFQIDQRNNGASQTFTAGATAVYCIDRYYAKCTGANVSGQRIDGTGAHRHSYRFTGSASNTGVVFGQRILGEDIADLAGKVITNTIEMSSSSLMTLTWTAYYADAANVFTAMTQIATGSIPITSTPTSQSFSFTLPALASAKNGIAIEFSGGALLGSQTLTFGGNDQLEEGAVATPFEYRTARDSERNCRTFFWAWNSLGRTTEPVGVGAMYSTVSLTVAIKLPEKMRGAPAFSFSSLAHFQCFGAGVNAPASTLSVDIAGAEIFSLNFGLGMTAGYAGYVRGVNAAARLYFDAELY